MTSNLIFIIFDCKLFNSYYRKRNDKFVTKRGREIRHGVFCLRHSSSSGIGDENDGGFRFICLDTRVADYVQPQKAARVVYGMCARVYVFSQSDKLPYSLFCKPVLVWFLSADLACDNLHTIWDERHFISSLIFRRN